jgi:hypothetical protein
MTASEGVGRARIKLAMSSTGSSSDLRARSRSWIPRLPGRRFRDGPVLEEQELQSPGHDLLLDLVAVLGIFTDAVGHESTPSSVSRNRGPVRRDQSARGVRFFQCLLSD